MQPQPHCDPCPTALLYLFVLHDHDQNRCLDGLELLHLLGTVLAQRNRGQPHPDKVHSMGPAPFTPQSSRAGPSPHPCPHRWLCWWTKPWRRRT